MATLAKKVKDLTGMMHVKRYRGNSYKSSSCDKATSCELCKKVTNLRPSDKIKSSVA